jgi:hypothetical protein
LKILPVKRTLQYLLCLVTALELCGGHLGVAQMVAWAQMIRDYTAEKGIAEGLKETFDGEHPCAMCCKIAKAKQQEERQAPLPLEKLEGLSKWLTYSAEPGIPVAGWTDRGTALRPNEPADHASSRRARPPVPPPRSFA